MTIHPNLNAPLVLSGRDVTAVLGPTNTGKTHLAIERMVAHESGVIGLPLRLLAREVYGRVCEKVGASKVSLITGEEKITPAGARYSVCTVEAMPRETDAAFVAIDEIQLASDFERGHIFTDRILHLRGRQETLLLGAATMRGILERLLRGISVVTRPRLSHLAYAGSKKITRLPRRSAIVAFSADEVYAIGELIRRQRGGAAVVLGALSPRTRNAQVALFQSGDVDFLVATDAIGMGLNLDLDHVAFAQNRKFDGFQYRALTPSELGQIAGRAGRHLRDGTFGVTGQVDPFDEDLVARLEGHDFEPVKVLQWRTSQFDFSSLDALRRSIETVAPVEGLSRALPAVDAQTLEQLIRDPEVCDRAVGAKQVSLLWDVCSLPDYRRIAPAQHAEICTSLYLDLVKHGRIDEASMAVQVDRADSTEGDIDTLSRRIAHIRTWTYVSNRPGWLADPLHWQEKTRDIEDRLSDALHERLTKRFVDRRTSVLMRRLRENSMLEAEISPSGSVQVEGHHVGELSGFRFTADQNAGGEDGKAIKAAAQKALAAEFDTRAERFSNSGNHDIALGSDGILRWIGAPVGALSATEDALRPRVILLADEQLTGPSRDKVAARAERFVSYHLETLLKPLVDLKAAEGVAGVARGLAFRLVENFGIINRRDIAEEMKSLDQAGRAALRRLGVRFGAYHIFVPTLVKPAPAGLITLLWSLVHDGKDKPGFGDVVHGLAAGRTSMVADPSYDRAFYGLAGFRVLGRRAVRVDILERLADLIRPALSWRPGTGTRPEGGYDGRAFLVTPPMMSILGANGEDLEEILKGLGYRAEPKAAADVKSRLERLDAEAREAIAKAEADRIAARAAEEAAKAAAAEGGAVTEDTPADTASPEAASFEGAPIAEADTAGSGDETVPASTFQADVADDFETVVDADCESSKAETGGSSETPVAANEASMDSADQPPSENAPTNDISASAETDAVAPAPDTQQAGPVSETPSVPVEQPKPILIWRPQRNEERFRPQQRGGRGPGDKPPRENNGARTGEQREARPGRSDNPARPLSDRRGREDRQGNKENTPARAPKERFDHGRNSGKPPFEGRRDGQKPPFEGRRDSQKPPHRDRQKDFAAAKPREEKPVRFDPDSPFAKLAALREQMKK